jgi:SagB-type dehydrogenase family enzyme
LFIIHPVAVAYTKKTAEGRLLCLETVASKPPIKVIDAKLVWALFALPRRFSRETALRIWSNEFESRTICMQLWEFCRAERLVIAADDIGAINRSLIAPPNAKNWQMVSYHAATRDYPFLNMAEKGSFGADNAVMQRYAADTLPPSAYQEFPFIKRTMLQKISFDSNLDDLVNNLSLAEQYGIIGLSILLDLCFGERDHIEMSFDANRIFLQLEIMKKSIPSGGGKHPAEAFLIVPHDWIVASGIYHYNVRMNSLDQISPVSTSLLSREWIQLLGLGSPHCKCGIVIATFCERAMWRYRDPRSWRALVIDVGHAVGMLETVANRIGYRLVATHHGFHEPLSEALAIDRYTQPVMYVGCLKADPVDV